MTGLKLIRLLIPIVVFAALILTGTAIAQDDSAAREQTTIEDSAVVTASVSDEEPSAFASLYPMSEERKATMASYSKFKNIWRFVEFFVGLAIMALFLFTGLSAKLRDWAQAARRKFLIVWLFLILFMLIDYLFTLPLSIYRNFVVESNYGFMNQTFMEWWGEDLLGLLMGAVIGIIPLWFLYDLINKTRKWWAWFAVGAIPFIVIMMVVIPIFISPMFNDFEPLKDKQLEQQILTLASEAGIEGSDVFQVNASKQSTKINAYVTGMFGSKRIVLYDTMIDNFDTDEIKFVMGHEMGHYVMNHLWKGLALAIFMMAFFLWLMNKTIHPVISRFKGKFKFDRLGDIASLPLIMIFISVLSLLFDPISNGYSRYHEHQCDIYGMDITGVSGESAATAFDKLSVFNLADPDPHPMIEFWFYSHPALNDRMEFVRNYRP